MGGFLWVSILFISPFGIVGLVLFIMLNATFNNISVISWQSVDVENHQPVASR